MTIGESIRLHREELGLTQEQLADDMNCSESMIHKWEQEWCYPNWASILKLVDVFGISVVTDALECTYGSAGI